MKYLEEDLEMQEYLYELCKNKGISADIRFKWLGDINRFYTCNKEFSLDCMSYYAKDINDVKNFFDIYLDNLYEYCEHPINSIALYIEDIVDMNGWYDVIVGGCLFVDDAIT